jgi:ankyrin repeat protein
MKHLLLTTIAAVLLAGCGESLRERAAKVQDSSIHSDVNEGNIEAVKEYLAAGGDVNAKHDMLGLQLTPLYVAASQGYKEISELLIANGADVNPKDENVMAPLRVAAELGHKEVVELLIAKGADVNGDMGGWTPLDVVAVKKSQSGLDLATINGLTEIADLLRKHGGKTRDELKAAESIVVAVELGNIEAVKQHLNDGTEVNVKDGTGRTPLHWAAIEGHKEIAELLIAAGADLNAKDKYGNTPLDWAMNVKGGRETADLLRKHGGKTGAELKAEGE